MKVVSIASMDNLRGYMSVQIPVKPYVKAYIEHQFKHQKIVLNRTKKHPVTEQLLIMLQRPENQVDERHEKRFSFRHQKAFIKIYISVEMYKRRGHHLTARNIMLFNSLMETHIKHQFYFLCHRAWKEQASFKAIIDGVRTELGIDDEAWDYDTMKRTFLRWRKNNGHEILKRGNPKYQKGPYKADDLPWI